MQQLKCAWNSNAVRIPLIIDGEGYSKNPAVEYPKVVTAIEAAISTGIYIIVDWHAFSDRLDIAVPFFKNISKLYGQYPHVLYETYNEPSWADSWTNLTAYHTAIINAIRANDPDNIIIVDQNKISYLAWTLSTRLSTTPSDQGCFFALKAGASVSQVGNSSYWSDYGAYVNQKLRATNNGIVC
uniref:Glycoside hydrolase family 5 domain-containing protein n=1 Tax=Acrobeloides nanus TaxID=290746 RepID=A0A914DJD2_9BILA